MSSEKFKIWRFIPCSSRHSCSLFVWLSLSLATSETGMTEVEEDQFVCLACQALTALPGHFQFHFARSKTWYNLYIHVYTMYIHGIYMDIQWIFLEYVDFIQIILIVYPCIYYTCTWYIQRIFLKYVDFRHIPWIYLF